MINHYKTHSGPVDISGRAGAFTYRYIDLADGTVDNNGVSMPVETLSIRAGEYGLDPSNPGLVLDIVLHETFVSYGDNDHPLWTAGSITEARERHLDTVSDVRKLHQARTPRRLDSAASSLHTASLAQMLKLCPITAGPMEAARRIVEIHRLAWTERPTPSGLTMVEQHVARMDREKATSR